MKDRCILLENGRSMLEMLGVLAIIGVLSIGGLTAYREAIARHRATKILSDANTAYAVLLTRNRGNALANNQPITTLGIQTDNGMTYTTIADPPRVTFNVANIGERTCEVLGSRIPTDMERLTRDCDAGTASISYPLGHSIRVIQGD